MRKQGKTDVIFLIFILFLFLAMLYGSLTSILYSMAAPPFFQIGSTGLSVTGVPFYFYYPYGIFAVILPVPFWTGIAVLMILYALIFFYLYKFNIRNLKANPLETPVGFISGYGSLAFAASIAVVGILYFFNTPIQSPSLSYEEKYPMFLYYQLIYAPFIEELEFRILPLGAYVYLRQFYSGKKGSLFYSFMFPGLSLVKSGRKLDRYDLLMILVTSTIFGYAHFAYGGWSFTKIPQAFIVGIFLGFGYMLYGPFVDIPLHFLFDGVPGISIIPGDYLGSIFILLVYLFLLIVNLVATIILFIVIRRNRKRNRNLSEIDEYSLT